MQQHLRTIVKQSIPDQVQQLPRLRLSRVADVVRQVPLSEDVARDRHAQLGPRLRATGARAAPRARRIAGPRGGRLEAPRPDGSRGLRLVAPGESVEQRIEMEKMSSVICLHKERITLRANSASDTINSTKCSNALPHVMTLLSCGSQITTAVA